MSIKSMIQKFKTNQENASYIRQYEKIIPEVLINRSMDVQNYFINEVKLNPETNGQTLTHHLPYKEGVEVTDIPFRNYNGSLVDATMFKDYNLREFDIDLISRNIGKLNEYADIVIQLSRRLSYEDLRHVIRYVEHLLPPWFVFPLYDSYAPHWSRGLAREYVACYLSFLEQATEEEKERHKEKYPMPDYLEDDVFEK